MTASVQLVDGEQGFGPTRRQRILTLARQHPAGVVGAVILLIFVVLAVASPWLAPYSTSIASGPVYAAPSAQHWLGTNDGGIDMLSLLMAGGRISMLVGFGAAGITVIPALLIGMTSGYFGGAVDTVLMRITDFFLVIPTVPIMIVIAAVWGPSLFHIIAVIGVLLWAPTARVLRAQVKSLRERAFVRRELTLGATNFRVLTRHIVPNIAALLIANTVVTLALAIFYETALAFLGLGDPTAVSWGTIIEDAFLRTAITDGAWWAIVPPGLCVALVVIAAYLVGSSIEDQLNPRLKVAHLSARLWSLRPLVGRGNDAW